MSDERIVRREYTIVHESPMQAAATLSMLGEQGWRVVAFGRDEYNNTCTWTLERVQPESLR